MTHYRRFRILAAVLVALALGVTFIVPRVRADQNTVNVNGSTQMYTLGSLLTNRFHGNRPDVYFSVNPNSSQFGFDNTCLGSTQIGMSDVYIQDYQLQEPNCSDMIGIPVAISAVAVAYNLPGKSLNERLSDAFTLAHPVKLTTQVLADIYTCKVTHWNDPAITSLNPGLPLPSARIQAFVSAEPGGAGFVFNQWLSSSVSGWQAATGTGLQPQWPANCSIGQPSSGAMVTAIHSTPYSVGFAGFDYTISYHLQAAALKNASGVFLTPSLSGLSIAINQALHYNLPGHHGISTDFRTSFVSVLGHSAYNPACFEFFLVHKNLRSFNPNATLRRNIKDFLWWSVQDNGGQTFIEQIEFKSIKKGSAKELAHGFVPVPAELRAAIRNLVDGIPV